MSNPQKPKIARRTKSQRRLTPSRMFAYRLAVWPASGLIELLWRTARLRVMGAERLDELLAREVAVVPVFWHQHLLMCARLLVDKRMGALKPGFMISPSVDGQAPTLLALRYGAHVVRGSGSYTGVRAVRGVHQAITKDGISPAITPDGPRGPRFKFKPGALFTAHVAGKAVVPMAYAAHPAKVLNTWDKFVIPAPYARVCIVFGEPYRPPADLDDERMELAQRELEQRLYETYREARAALDA